MPKQIFPKEIIENSVEAHHFKNSNRSKLIYVIILLALITTFLSLPLINIGIYNTSEGLIRANRDRVILQASNSGIVSYYHLENNLTVCKGDTLLIINNLSVNQKLETTTNQIIVISNFIKDLKLLMGQNIIQDSLISIKYKQDHNLYLQKLIELKTRLSKSQIDYARNKELFGKGVISKSALEDFKLEYDLNSNSIGQYKKEKKSFWESYLLDYQNQWNDLQASFLHLKETNSLFLLIAPVNGILLNVKGISVGSFVQGGFELGEISPDSKLMIESYVRPTDIGFIHKGNAVKYQVSAFNYNQWGLARGFIEEIGVDIQIVNNTPMFRVISSLEEEYLSLKNGYRGQLIKGMQVSVRYELTERSLFDLLYDKMDDWLNPTNQLAQN